MTLEILLLFAIIALPLLSNLYIMIVYNTNKRKDNNKRLTGYQTARIILDNNGLTNVDIVEVGGSLTDHYDPVKKIVCLSTDISRGTSISALSVAAHECGHAIQDKEAYLFLRIRSSIYPIVNFSSSFAYWMILIGLMIGYVNLLYIGICFSFIGLLFQLITLPVEFNASKRAIHIIEQYNLIDRTESLSCRSVLRAAAYTYVAGTLSAALEILRFFLLARSRD